MLYKKTVLKTLKKCAASPRDLGHVVANCQNLLSPQELICHLIPARYNTEIQPAVQGLIQSAVRSEHYRGLYKTNELFISYADMLGQKKQIYLVEIDIKDCTNLIGFITSHEVYVIKSFLFVTCTKLLCKYLKTRSVYSFDYTKNDDCMVVIQTQTDIETLRNILIEIANVVTESVLQIYPMLPYKNDCIVNFGISVLGQNKSEAALFHDFEEKTNIRKHVKKSDIPVFKNYFTYKYQDRNPQIHSIQPHQVQRLMTNLYFKNEDAAGFYCHQECRFFDLESPDRYLMNIKFNNFSGLNKLMQNKYYSYLLLGEINRFLNRILDQRTCNLYFIGQNTFWITSDKKVDFQRIVDKIERVLDKKINNKRIYNFFGTKLNIPKNLRFRDLKSRKGYKDGISISNISIIDLAEIHSPQDMLDFKIKSYMQQFDQKDTK